MRHFLLNILAVLLIVASATVAPRASVAGCLSNAYQTLLGRAGVEVSAARKRISYSYEIEYNIEKTPKVLDFYRPDGYTDAEWLALPIEQRVQQVKAMQNHRGDARGVAGLSRVAGAPEFLDPHLRFELHGNLEISANAVTDDLKETHRQLDWIWETIGPGSVQGHVARPAAAGSLDGMANWIKLDYDVSQVESLDEGYKAWARSGGKATPGRNLAHDSLRPLTEDTFHALEERLKAPIPKDAEDVDVNTKLIYGVTHRPDLYGPDRTGFEIRQCHQRLACIKQKMAELDALLRDPHNTRISAWQRIPTGPLIGNTSFEALPGEVRNDLLAIFAERPNGRALAQNFSFPLLDWMNHPLVEMQERGGDAQAQLAQATARYIQAIHEVARSSESSAARTRELQIAMAEWAHESGIRDLLSQGRQRLADLPKVTGLRAKESAKMARLLGAASIAPISPNGAEADTKELAARIQMILLRENFSSPLISKALDADPGLYSRLGKRIAQTMVFEKGPLRDSLSSEFLLRLSKLEDAAGDRALARLRSLEEKNPGFLFHSGLSQLSSQLGTEQEILHFLSIAAGEKTQESLSWLRAKLADLRFKGPSAAADRVFFNQLVIFTADGMQGFTRDQARVRIGEEWTTIQLKGKQMAPRADSELSPAEVRTLAAGQARLLNSGKVQLRSDAELLALTQPAQKRVFIFYNGSFPGVIVDGELYQLGSSIVHQAVKSRIAGTLSGFKLVELKASTDQHDRLIASLKDMISRDVKHDHYGNDTELSCAQFVHENLKYAGIFEFPTLVEQRGGRPQENYTLQLAAQGDPRISGVYWRKTSDDKVSRDVAIVNGSLAVMAVIPAVMIGAAVYSIEAENSRSTEYRLRQKIEEGEAARRASAIHGRARPEEEREVDPTPTPAPTRNLSPRAKRILR